ncbi:MAG: TVP38/TMEM64 family protein [Spirochaetales bacterium]|nr:TVP38/TMEM64 family protein [Spirochaetales bacterium]
MRLSPLIQKLALATGLVLFALALGALLVVYHAPLWRLLENREHLKALLLAEGVWAPLSFMGLQALQVVIFVIPGEVTQLVGGWLFGTWLGCLWSILGITAGAGISFVLARLLGRRVIGVFLRSEKLLKWEKALSQPRWLLAIFLLFLIPGIPKDALCYIAGFSRVPLGLFLVVSATARFPALFLSSWAGSAAGSEHWAPVVVIAVFTVLAITLGWLFRHRMEKALSKIL